MAGRKGGRLASILFAAKLADPVSDRSITDIVSLSHFLHGLFIHKDGAKGLVASVRCLHGVHKEASVIAPIHGHLLENCHPFNFHRGVTMTSQQERLQEQNGVLNLQKAGGNEH